jgi:prepilin-type processing-associated H-X9-DG protein
VELLVVIGIIAVLIAILLPTINAARRQGATAACLANLRNLGQALQVYQAENRGSYPFAYYISSTTTSSLPAQAEAGDGGATEQDSRTYVWWSVLRGVMRGKGFPMDNSILMQNGSIGTRFMEAFNCPVGNDPRAGCDFSGNAAIMIIKALEIDQAGTRHRANYIISKPATSKTVPPDCAVLWDAPELAFVDPPFSRQYVASYAIDAAHYMPSGSQSGMLVEPRRPWQRYRGMDQNAGDASTEDSAAIDPGLNIEINSTNISKLAGNIRWRHGKNNQANFLFGDGSAKTMEMNKWVSGGSPQSPSSNSIFRGSVTRLMFRPKLPPGYKTTPG